MAPERPKRFLVHLWGNFSAITCTSALSGGFVFCYLCDGIVIKAQRNCYINCTTLSLPAVRQYVALHGGQGKGKLTQSLFLFFSSLSRFLLPQTSSNCNPQLLFDHIFQFSLSNSDERDALVMISEKQLLAIFFCENKKRILFPTFSSCEIVPLYFIAQASSCADMTKNLGVLLPAVSTLPDLKWPEVLSQVFGFKINLLLLTAYYRLRGINAVLTICKI